MPTEIPRSLVEFVLLGPEDDRRQLQDSPILGDVWIRFAQEPASSLDLLLTPYKDYPASSIAAELAAEFEQQPPETPKVDRDGASSVTAESLERLPGNSDVDHEIAYLHGIVAARLSFQEIVRVVVPMTHWWKERRIAAAFGEYVTSAETMQRHIRAILFAARKRFVNDTRHKDTTNDLVMRDLPGPNRYIALAGLMLWAKDHDAPGRPGAASSDSINRLLADEEGVEDLVRGVVEALRQAVKTLHEPETKGTIWTVSLNRQATTALAKSVPAVKADAAHKLFSVDCSEIVWAIIDSGVDATHHAFKSNDGSRCRIARSFDFTRIRQIISLENARADRAKARAELLRSGPLKKAPSAQEAEENLRELATDAAKGRSIDWKLVEAFVEIDPADPKARPPTNHGTHVAGILAADVRAMKAVAAMEAAAAKQSQQTGRAPAESETEDKAEQEDWASGMCPDIRLYDFRVLAPSLRETEFAIIAALQYIRYLNERNGYMSVHGANLSLSIPHDVRNYACGRTPVCNESERLVNSGVVVVAAAGNRGYQSFETNDGSPYEGYTAFSITDPGNADGVITVGATHRYWPHTYGVSFFSSRGPTGDGRLKPDLVAPGERIRAPFPGNQWGDLDGTSMAAPHVSGAAAMLMARYSELIGQPRRIKKILCDSATDLGRERSFQGHGMLDVLRAFQSI